MVEALEIEYALVGGQWYAVAKLLFLRYSHLLPRRNGVICIDHAEIEAAVGL